MNRTIIVCGFFVLTAASVLAEEKSGEKLHPILGTWEIVAFESKDEKITNPADKMQFQFSSDGTFIAKASQGTNAVETIKGTYNLISTNIVTYTLTGEFTERQRYRIDGDMMYFEHLDFSVKNTLKRIREFSLK